MYKGWNLLKTVISHVKLISICFFTISCFIQPSGKVRRPLRSSLSGPVEELNAEKLSQKLHNVAKGQQDRETRTEFSPSPPQRGSLSGTPPSLSGPIRRSSSEILPTPPVVSKDVTGTRRVRSGPKERSPPVLDSINRVKSGPVERGDPIGTSNEQTVGQTSPTSERSKKKGGERGGSGDKRRKKSQLEEDKPKDELVSYYEEHVKPLLTQMEERFAEKNVKDLCHDCLKLWNALEKKGLIGKASGSFSARRRGEILRTIFKFLDLSDPRLILRLGRLILSVSIFHLLLLLCSNLGSCEHNNPLSCCTVPFIIKGP